jgi:hypothetical protein
MASSASFLLVFGFGSNISFPSPSKASFHLQSLFTADELHELDGLKTLTR